jgi:crotonobetainyl-CoA:carnitine CoA-transferase CaiB-like acyl-CoA transferase
MKTIQTEVKWAVIFSVMGLAWMLLEKLVGLHGKYIDYHMYLTNVFMIPAVWVTVLALKDKKRNATLAAI